MQLTNEKSGKVVMSRWKHAFICVTLYFVGYMNGRMGWANIWHGVRWHMVWMFLFVLPLAVPFAY